MYYCAQDILEYLMNSVGGGAQDSEHRLLRAAVAHAYRDVINARDWSWHVASTTLSSPEDSTPPALSYLLPPDVKNVDSLVPPLTQPTAVRYVSPTEWERINVALPQINAPIFWTVVRHGTMRDRWLLKVAGSPPTNLSYRITYRRRPQPLRYMGYEPQCRDGTLSINGMVRRYGTANLFPEGITGVNGFTAEEIIGDNNSLIGQPPGGAKTVVSDYVDVSDNMFTAILSGAEAWAAKMMGKNVEGAMTVYHKDLRLAFEADNVAPISGNRVGGLTIGTPRALGYYSPSGADTGV